jgi:8-oxo-dGTP diphosphatase
MATSIAPAELPLIKAAGGILLRSTSGGEEVMIVYRNRYQDWTLPKGKLKDGESFPEAALREVEEETGCSCRLGSYLGVLSYAHNGVPKVVMFWKMSVLEQREVAPTEEIGEAVWLPAATAIQRLTHAQEKSLLARVVSVPRPVAAPTGPSPEPPAFLQDFEAQKKASREGKTTRARLSRELEALRVELAFLERRSQQADKSWAAAASEHLNHGRDCLAQDDIEGGLLSLQASRRYAVLGLNPSELAARAQILRDEARKNSSSRSAAIQRLLGLPDEMLTAARVADAMSLRDEDSTEQNYLTRIAGDRLRVLLLICGLGTSILLPLMLLRGSAGVVAPVLLFGLLGASACAAQALIHGKSESRAPNLYVMLAPVLLGAVASLAGYAIHQYLVFMLDPGQPHRNALFAMAFLFGCLGQRVLARFTRPRQRPPVRPI